MKPRVLIVDDEKNLRWSLSIAFKDDGYETFEAETGEGALTLVQTEQPDLVLLDIRLPDMDGIEVLRQIRRIDRDVIVIMMTAFGLVESAFEAVSLGAHNYLSKPFEPGKVRSMVREALENVQLKHEAREVRYLRVGNRDQDRLVLGKSRRMEEIAKVIEKVAQSPAATVLIHGESGTGKELVARAIHFSGLSSSSPFVELNCASLPENLLESELFGHERGAFTDARTRKPGLVEIATGGTLFLDEIGEMPIGLQAKLLRLIENKRFRRVGGLVDIEVNTRIMAATNRDLKASIQAGRFREDLYFRLKVIPIEVPPLRSRPEDIPLLASYFIDRFNRELCRNVRGLNPDARRLVSQYAWPGNVRELKNVIERAILLESKDFILPDHLPLEIGTPGGNGPVGARSGGSYRFSPVPLTSIERRHIEATLEYVNGNKTRAAKLLGISRQTLREKIRRYSDEKVLV
jgi:two-component system response regulator AtoC